MKRTVAFLLMLSCCLCFIGCGDNEGESSNTGALNNDSSTDKKEFSLPYDIETDDGLLQISNIYLRQEKTDHGYDGTMAIEFDCSGMDYDDYYWFDKDYSIYVHQGHNTLEESIEIYDILHKKSEIGEEGKKYYFCSIDECKEEFCELYFDLNININHSPADYELKIAELCTKCEIVEEFPQDVLDVYVETVLD